MLLSELKKGESANVLAVKGTGALRHHLLDMGLTPQTVVTLRKVAPMGDPIQIQLRGYELTLRLSDAKAVEIEKIGVQPNAAPAVAHASVAHPRIGELGEAGDYCIQKIGKEIPKGQPITFALAGNQNCGKTTLFNQLTGARQHVGNFPGVTVDKKEGKMRKHPEATVIDLPGIYSLSPYSNEEIVTRDYLLKERPTAIINIVDASNLERNLYLTMQLMELGIPIVLALNMMDEVQKNGGSVRINELEHYLGIPVVPISAVKNQGIGELIDHAMHVALQREAPAQIDFCKDTPVIGDPVGAVHRCIHAVAHLIEPFAQKVHIPTRFAATKVIEKDTLIMNQLALPTGETEALYHIIENMEKESGMDREAALANMRFSYIERLCQQTVVKPHESLEHKRSVAIDKILTGTYTAIPAFLAIMAFIFVMTFNYLGAYLSDGMAVLVDGAIAGIDDGLTALQVNPVLHSLITDAVCKGIGSVFSFLPTIVLLFFFLSILEDTGYMARVAFVMDKLLRKIGLSGRSVVPMLVGFGCSVPAIMATRTLSSERDRKMTILLTPFMSCSAKLPIYGFLTTALFPAHLRGLVVIALYLIGILCGMAYAVYLKKFYYKGQPVPFVMELPNYRMPGALSVCRLIWDKAKGFIQKAFTVIFAATIIVWFLETFDTSFNIAASPDTSLIALLGNFIAPVFAPLGFGDWRVATAIVTGFMAKESVVSTITVLLQSDISVLPTMFTPFTAFVFLVFTLLYTPCVAAIATVRREMDSGKAALMVVVSQCVIAWFVAFIVHTIGTLLGF